METTVSRRLKEWYNIEIRPTPKNARPMYYGVCYNCGAKNYAIWEEDENGKCWTCGKQDNYKTMQKVDPLKKNHDLSTVKDGYEVLCNFMHDLSDTLNHNLINGQSPFLKQIKDKADQLEIPSVSLDEMLHYSEIGWCPSSTYLIGQLNKFFKEYANISPKVYGILHPILSLNNLHEYAWIFYRNLEEEVTQIKLIHVNNHYNRTSIIVKPGLAIYGLTYNDFDKVDEVELFSECELDLMFIQAKSKASFNILSVPHVSMINEIRALDPKKHFKVNSRADRSLEEMVNKCIKWGYDLDQYFEMEMYSDFVF